MRSTLFILASVGILLAVGCKKESPSTSGARSANTPNHRPGDVEQSSPQAQHHAGTRTPSITTKEKVKVVRSECVDSVRVAAMAGPIFQAEVVSARAQMRLLLIELEADFPAGDWKLFFGLQDPASEGRVFPPIAFQVGQQSAATPLGTFHRALGGAYASVEANNRICLFVNAAGAKPCEISFSLDQPWKGGKGAVEMIFEIPATANAVELINLKPAAAQRRLGGPDAP